jgi:hypothetical protein
MARWLDTLRRSSFGPWAGLIAGALGWAVHQQALADLLYWDCSRSSPMLHALVTLLMTVLILVGLGWSWEAREGAARDGQRRDGDRVVAEISLGSGLLFLLTILVQALAAFLVPACER